MRFDHPIDAEEESSMNQDITLPMQTGKAASAYLDSCFRDATEEERNALHHAYRMAELKEKAYWAEEYRKAVDQSHARPVKKAAGWLAKLFG